MGNGVGSLVRGMLEKGEWRSRRFAVLTTHPYAPRVKSPAALLSAPF